MAINEYGVAFAKGELLTDLGKTYIAKLMIDPETGKRKSSVRMVNGLSTIDVYNRMSKYFDNDEVYNITTQAQMNGKYIMEDNSIILIYSGASGTWMVIADSAMYNELIKPVTSEQRQLSMRNRLEVLKLSNGSHLDDYQISIIMSAFKNPDSDEYKLIRLLGKEVLHLNNKIKEV